MNNIRQYASTAKSVSRLQKSIKTSSSMIRPVQYVEERTMKLTFKQRIRNWLLDNDNDNEKELVYADDYESPSLQSQGFRLHIYSASGGTIVETTKYDRKSDENRNTLHVVTEDKDLGNELAKIITMESLR